MMPLCRLVTIALALASGAGCTSALHPDRSRPAARVTALPTPAYGLAPPNWGDGLPTPARSSASCPQERTAFEAAFDLTPANACGSLRAGPPIATVGDGDTPTSAKTYAPIC